MPLFIDNKGQHVVPSLDTLIITSGALREADLNSLGHNLRSHVKDQLQRLGCDGRRTPCRTPVYLVKDIQIRTTPGPSMKMDLSQQAFEDCVKYSEPIGVAYSKNPQREAARLQRWQVMRDIVSRALRDIVVVKLQMVNPAKNFIYLRPLLGRRATFALEISPVLMNRLLDESVDVGSIQRLIFFSYPGTPPILCFRAVPALTHLEIWQPIRNLYFLLQYRATLLELRIFLHPDVVSSAFHFLSVVCQLTSLQLLFVYWPFGVQLPLRINWARLALPSSLKSLSLIGITQTRASELVGFLLKELTHRDEVVARQELLEDFTVTGVRKEVMEAVYDNEALTPRMKERIFCDISLEHLSSAILHVSKKMTYGLSFALGSLIRRALQMMANTDRPPLIMTRVILDVLHSTCVLNHGMAEVLTLLSVLLNPETLNIDQNPSVFANALECTTNLLQTMKNINFPWVNLGLANDLLHLLDGLDVKPSDPRSYLEAVVFLFKYPDSRSVLPSLFMKQVKELQPRDLGRFFAKMKGELCHFCLDLLFNGGSSSRGAPLAVHDEVKLSDSIKNMLVFILLNTSEEDLLVAANATLRRCISESQMPGTWFDSETLDDERKLNIKYCHS